MSVSSLENTVEESHTRKNNGRNGWRCGIGMLLHHFNKHLILASVSMEFLFIAERAERSEAAEPICHLSAWCKMYMKFLQFLHT